VKKGAVHSPSEVVAVPVEVEVMPVVASAEVLPPVPVLAVEGELLSVVAVTNIPVVLVAELVENAPVVVEWLPQRSHPQLSSRPLFGSP